MLKLEEISLTLGKETSNPNKIFSNYSLTIEDREFVNIIGENGSGKSTLLKIIAGEINIDSGKIIIDNKEVTNMNNFARAEFIAKVPQNPNDGSVKNFTIEENMSIALSRGKKRSLFCATDINKRIIFKEALSILQMNLENRLDDMAGNLSGGQLQALNLIMATISPAKILLLDEHTSALSPNMAEIIMEITNRLFKKLDLTILMISHNPKFIETYGTKIIKLNPHI